MSNSKDFKVKNGIKPTAYHEGVGTVVSEAEGYNLAGASLTGATLNVSSQDSQGQSLFFKPDGTKLYYLGSLNDNIYQYSLSTAWDLSTASYDSVTFNLTSQATVAQALYFRADGQKFYILDANDIIYQYDLSTAWDFTTASYSSKSFTTTQDTTVCSIDFKTDGTKLYMVGATNDNVYQYSLSTAWDISTASYDSVSFSVASQDPIPTDMYFKPDGLFFYILGEGTGSSDNTGHVYEYSLSVAWDISTASYTGDNTTITQDPNAFYLSSDGTKMYVVDYLTEVIEEYSTALNTATLDLSTGSVFEITPTSDIKIGLSNPADSGTVSAATLLLDQQNYAVGSVEDAEVIGSYSTTSQETDPFCVAANDTGTIVYILGVTNDTVYQYSLSTAYDLDTASYTGKSFSVATQETNPTGLFFKPDGTSFWVIGRTTDDIFQYNMSTAWDVSTASYASVSYNASGTSNNFYGLTFSNDGSYWFSTDDDSDRIIRFTMSTPWDVSTSSLSQTLLLTSLGSGNGPRGVAFDSSDATKMFLSVNTNSVNSALMEVSLPSDYSISSVSSYVFKDVAPQGRYGDIFVGSSKSMILYVGSMNDTVHTFSLRQLYTITYDTSLQWAGGTAPTSPAIGETDVLTFSTDDGGTTYKAVQSIDGAS